MSEKVSAAHLYMAEVIGTFVYVFMICSTEATSRLITGSPVSLGFKLLGYAFSVFTSFYLVGGISGAHLNWAVTLYRGLSRKMPLIRVPGYIVAQTIGAFLAAALVYTVYGPILLVVDPDLTEATANVFFCGINPSINFTYAFLTEVVDAALLVLLMQTIADEKNPLNLGRLNPLIVAVYFAGIGLCNYPLTMICMNPARDFGPRLFAYLVGYGTVAIPGIMGFEMLVYTSAPIVGGLIGGFFYDLAIKPFWRRR